MGAVLFSIRNNVPAGWTAQSGLRTLFPPGYNGSIATLKNYVYSVYSPLATEDPSIAQTGEVPTYSVATCWFMADGSGRWFFGWKYAPCIVGTEANVPGSLYSYNQAGFVFKSKIGGDLRAWMDGSNPGAQTRSCAAGTDTSIANNWPNLFSSGGTLIYQVGVLTRPTLEAVWNGKTELNLSAEPLTGGAVAGVGNGSGSTLFPFPGVAPDCYVSGVAASMTAKALKAGSTARVDVGAVTQFVSAPSFNSPSKQAVLDYLKLPNSDQVIADANILATQVFNNYRNQGGPAPAAGVTAGVSPFVTQTQIASAISSANTILGTARVIPSALWAYLKAYNTNPELGKVFDEIDKLLDETADDPAFLRPWDIALQALIDVANWIAGLISGTSATDVGAQTPPDPAATLSPPPDPSTSDGAVPGGVPVGTASDASGDGTSAPDGSTGSNPDDPGTTDPDTTDPGDPGSSSSSDDP